MGAGASRTTIETLLELSQGRDREALRAGFLQAKREGFNTNEHVFRAFAHEQRWPKKKLDAGTVLHAAACRGRAKIIAEILVGSGKDAGFVAVNDVNYFGQTALHSAASHGNADAVTELLDRSGLAAGFTAILDQDEAGASALHCSQNADCVRALLGSPRLGREDKKKLILTHTKRDGTALHGFCKCSEDGKGAERIIELFNHVDGEEMKWELLEMVDEDGDTCLHHALSNRGALSIRALLGIVAKLASQERTKRWCNMVNHEGKTAVHCIDDLDHREEAITVLLQIEEQAQRGKDFEQGK
jgi:ankyrin repeat protein